jgi:hypothetical protein
MAIRHLMAGTMVAMSEVKMACVAVADVAGVAGVAESCMAMPRVTISYVQMASIAVTMRAARMAVTPETTQRHGGEARGA